jgi:glycosyltransferase involved in cell wall biosynthesis
VSATLHDLPIVPPAGAPVDPLALRRTAAYRRVALACAGVVVNSRHEQERLAAILGGACPPVTVIPLPVDPPADRRPDPRPVRNVAVLGFLYPGKGHDEVLRAVAALPPEIMMTALGRPSDGHEDLAGELQQLARSLHRTLEVTGFVPDAELPAALHAAGVPVAPHRTVSASGSIATWLGAGRRPLVPDVAYTRELEQRCPGALWLYPPDAAGLTGCLLAAVAHPEQTWLGEVAVGPSTALAGWS